MAFPNRARLGLGIWFFETLCRNLLASDVPVRRCALRPSFPPDDYHEASMSGDLPLANVTVP